MKYNINLNLFCNTKTLIFHSALSSQDLHHPPLPYSLIFFYLNHLVIQSFHFTTENTHFVVKNLMHYANMLQNCAIFGRNPSCNYLEKRY